MKKLTVIILVLALLFSFAGCDSDIYEIEIADADTIEESIEEVEEIEEVIEEEEEEDETDDDDYSYSSVTVVSKLTSTSSLTIYESETTDETSDDDEADDDDETSDADTADADTADADTADATSFYIQASEDEETIYTLYEDVDIAVEEDENDVAILSFVKTDEGIEVTIIDETYDIYKLFEIIYQSYEDYSISGYYITDAETVEYQATALSEEVEADYQAFLTALGFIDESTDEVVGGDDEDISDDEEIEEVATYQLSLLSSYENAIVLVVPVEEGEADDITISITFAQETDLSDDDLQMISPDEILTIS